MFFAGALFGGVLYFSSGTWLPIVTSSEFLHKDGTMLFTGDIMLARMVERYMNDSGAGYPFLGTAERIADADVAVGNFESTVPEVHVPTPNFTFSFSVTEEHFGALKDVGFDALSFANNHAYDFGREGYTNTKEICVKENMQCFGHPIEAPGDTVVLEAGSTKVGLVGLHTLFAAPSMEAVADTLRSMEEESDIQIAYVHWGDEYILTHNTAQETFAHTLIDMGFDAVIGHHPHVVQDIEIYNEKPIFYSLGNFVFDQYFDTEVQQGLVVELTFKKKYIEYELVPVSAIQTRSQPHIVEGTEGEGRISDLLDRSHGVEIYRAGSTLQMPW